LGAHRGIERLKHLHRTEPTADAASEFTKWELEATLLMKRKYLKKGEPLPGPRPSIGQIVLWLSEFGGYTGKSSGGPPGSITIRRGLDFIAPVALALQQLESMDYATWYKKRTGSAIAYNRQLLQLPTRKFLRLGV